jgi:hypothetical protein
MIGNLSMRFLEYLSTNKGCRCQTLDCNLTRSLVYNRFGRDIVAVMSNGAVPYLLRPVENEDKYKFIGEWEGLYDHYTLKFEY